MKRNAVPFVLLALALLFAYLVLRDPASVSDGERALRKDHVFSSWRRDRVTRIELSGPGGEVTLDRDPAKNAWSLHGSPEEIDAARADVLFGELEHAVVLRKVEADEGTQARAPRVRGTIAMGELTYRFSLGAEAKKPEGAAYLTVEGEGVVVVEKRLVEALLVSVAEYRDKRLLPSSGDSPTEITVAPATGPSFTLVKDGRTRHRLGNEGPFTSRLETEALLSALAELRAVKFVGAAEGALATKDAPVSLTVRGEKGDVSIAFGGACPNAPADVVVARRSPAPVFACVPAGVVAAIRRPQATYEDRMVFFVRPDELEELTVTRPGRETLDVARKGSGFRLRSASKDLDSDAADGVRAWATSLVSLGGEATPVPSPDAREVARVTVMYGKVTESIRFVRALDGRMVGIRGDSRAILLPTSAERIVSPPNAFSRGTSLVPKTRVLREFWLDCDGLVQHVLRKDGLRFAPPEPFPLDAALAAHVASTLLSARAEVWVADARTDLMPTPSKCSARLAFDDDSGPAGLTIELSSPAEATVYGSIAGERETFLAPRELVEAIRRPLASRDGFLVDPTQAFELTVFYGLGAAKVSMDGEALEAGAATDGGAERQTPRDALYGIRPLFVVRRGSMTRAEEGDTSTRVEVGLRRDGGPTYAKLRFGKEFSAPEGKVVYAERDGLPFVFAVRAELVAPFRAMVEKRP